MTKALTTALLLLAIIFIVAHLEWRNAPTEQAIRYEQLRACDFTIKDGTSAQMSSERCYFLKSRK